MGTLITLAGIVLEPRLVLCGLVFTLAWVAVFAATLWAGPSLAAGQPIRRGPHLEHEGFAAIVLGFFVLSEGVPLVWLATWLFPSLSIWAVAGVVMSGLAVFRCAWLPRQLIEDRSVRMRVMKGVGELIAYIHRRRRPHIPSLTLMVADLLLQRRRWGEAVTLLAEFPPNAELRLALRERWVLLAFRAQTMAGVLAGAGQVIRQPEVPDTPAIRGARLWLAALEGRGHEVLESLDGPDRPKGLDARLEIVLRAHALAALERNADARAVLKHLGTKLELVLEPEGPATTVAREMRGSESTLQPDR